MTAIRITAFSGEVPRLIPRLLPDSAAQAAYDTRLENGDIRPYREDKNTFTDAGLPTAAPATIYRFLGTWLSWSTLVHAAQGPVADDRLYYTGNGAPKMYTDSIHYAMKIVAPVTALTVADNGAGAGDVISCLFVYTNVSQYGEESEPSPLSTAHDLQVGDQVTLSGFSTSMGDRTATYQRIYQSQTSLSGDTTLYLIDERAAGTGNYVYTFGNETIQEPLPSQDWNQPPDTLSGLISLPNGMMAGFDGKKLYFSEPYIPHAYPQKYILTTDYDIVALGAYGSNIVVTTTGNPYVCQGTAPENMLMEKLELNYPCINAAGVVDLGYAIAYPTNDGLAVASAGGVRIATEALFTRSDWQKLSPSTMVAGQHDGRYLASYSYSDSLGNEFSGTIIIDMTGEQPFLVRSANQPLAYFHDITTGQLFFLVDQTVWEFDAIGLGNKEQNWKSKEFVLPRPERMGAIMIESGGALTSDEEQAILAQAQEIIDQNTIYFAQPSIGGELNGAAINAYALNDDILEIPPNISDGYMTCSVYADKVLIATITDLDKMKRLPGGLKARKWEIEITSNRAIAQITMARNGDELKRV